MLDRLLPRSLRHTLACATRRLDVSCMQRRANFIRASVQRGLLLCACWLMLPAASLANVCYRPGSHSGPLRTCHAATGAKCTHGSYSSAELCCGLAPELGNVRPYSGQIVLLSGTAVCGCAAGAWCQDKGCLTGGACSCVVADAAARTCTPITGQSCITGAPAFDSVSECCEALGPGGGGGVCADICRSESSGWRCSGVARSALEDEAPALLRAAAPPTYGGQLPAGTQPLAKCRYDRYLPNVSVFEAAVEATYSPGPAQRRVEDLVGRGPAASANLRQASTSPLEAAPSTIVVNVTWHVLVDATGAYDVTTKQIAYDMVVLNTLFNRNALQGTGYQFVLSGVYRWAEDKAASYAMCGQSLQQLGQYNTPSSNKTDWDTVGYFAGLCQSQWFFEVVSRTPGANSKSSLNVFTSNLASVCSLGGSASFPWWRTEGFHYGVFMDYAVVGRESRADILAHEVGHWMGLYHPFNLLIDAPAECTTQYAIGNRPDGNCCKYVDDFVSDTPPVDSRDRLSYIEPSCLLGSLDTCTGDGQGPDLVDNIMDYTASKPACKKQFSSGQHARMRAFWALWRMDN